MSEARQLTPHEQRLVEATAMATADAVVKAFRDGGCPGACGLSSSSREHMGHLVGMLARDQGIEDTRRDLQFARAMRQARDRVGTYVLCLISGAIVLWAVHAIWQAATRGPK